MAATISFRGKPGYFKISINPLTTRSSMFARPAAAAKPHQSVELRMIRAAFAGDKDCIGERFRLLLAYLSRLPPTNPDRERRLWKNPCCFQSRQVMYRRALSPAFRLPFPLPQTNPDRERRIENDPCCLQSRQITYRRSLSPAFRLPFPLPQPNSDPERRVENDPCCF